MGSGTPVERATRPQIDSTVRTRKATPEELAELEAQLRRKYGEKKQEPDKGKVIGFPKRKPNLDEDSIRLLISYCSRISRHEWERLRAFVIVAGAVHGWDEEMEHAEKAD